MHRQVIDTSSLSNWTALRSRMSPLLYQSVGRFGDQTLPSTEHVDKDVDQIKFLAGMDGVHGLLPEAI